MRRECRERFPSHRLQRKPPVSDSGMHHGTCVTHVPWRMSGSLTRGGGENVPGIPGACATRNFTYLVRGAWNNGMRCMFCCVLMPTWSSLVSPQVTATTIICATSDNKAGFVTILCFQCNIPIHRVYRNEQDFINQHGEPGRSVVPPGLSCADLPDWAGALDTGPALGHGMYYGSHIFSIWQTGTYDFIEWRNLTFPINYPRYQQSCNISGLSVHWLYFSHHRVVQML